MAVKPTNLLIMMADEHTRSVLGCYGNSVVKTPNLDRLAARGTLFRNAYSPSPICVPARATFATGRHVHETGNWDNACGYIGTPHSWGHVLQDAGHPVGSIGKLHYRREEDPTGFDFQILPMHLVNGVGDVLGCVKDPLTPRWKTRTMAEKIGPGDTSYSAYDDSITEATVDWLSTKENTASEKPWTLFVSWVCPHFPLIAPQKFYDMYAESGLMPTKAQDPNEHPWLAELRGCMLYDNFTDESTGIALAAYYALVSFMDANVGRVLDTLDEMGLAESTRIVYVSDHGDNVGERGLWGKSTLFEESAGIPAIIAGPGIPEGRECTTPVTLIDIYPTVVENVGLTSPEKGLPGRSLIELANAPDAPSRVAFVQYHATGACSGAFMVRKDRWKFNYYVGFEPELYDLKSDPGELENLAGQAKCADVIAELETELRSICDPEEVNRRAKRDQAAMVEAHGGREAVIAKGGFGATPPPGEKPEFITTA